MGNAEIRKPIQKRSIEKKEKIIKCGFELICKKGYYNTNTAEIAKVAGVSTGIVYQYFKDKHDILIEGIRLYANSLFYPMLFIANKNIKTNINKENFSSILRDMIDKFIKNHKISKTAHEEIIAMTHSDQEVAQIFHNSEMEMANKVTSILLENGFKSENLSEEVHVAIGMIDNLCHEIVYHKHRELDYEKMINICNLNILRSRSILRDNYVIEDNGFNISGGEKQKILLARSLLKNSNYIILDEALSEVSFDEEKEILDKIFEFYSDKTIIYVSHKKEIIDLFKKKYKLERS